MSRHDSTRRGKTAATKAPGAVQRAVDTGLSAAAILDHDRKPFDVASTLDVDGVRAIGMSIS
jgi:hypothetical protein